MLPANNANRNDGEEPCSPLVSPPTGGAARSRPSDGCPNYTVHVS